MTAKGVRVFKGGGGCPHKNTDFLALAEIPGLPKRERRALAAIDKLIKTPRVAVLVGGFAAVAARARPARASHE
jgi:tRNA A37 N6-isopentenylltransferase MiaA